MAEDRLKIWETLFEKALCAIDSVHAGVLRAEDWSFGGGTVLMRRYRHRFSKDIDIFLPDPQYLGHLSPRLNDTVDALAPKHIEQANFLKLYFDEGEVDFIVSPSLTTSPVVVETLFDRQVWVQTSAEILAKKINYRGDRFTARDIFDFALIADKEPRALSEIAPILREQRDVLLARIASADGILRKTFAALEMLDYRRSYDECLAVVRKALAAGN